MPKKLFFERDLINVNIRATDYHKVNKLYKGHNEPFYSVFARVCGMVTRTHIEAEQERMRLITMAEKYKERALELEAKLKNDGQCQLF
mgnify:FL=1